MTAPLVTPSRDALKEAECECGHPVGEGWHTSSRGCVYLGVGPTACLCDRDWHDALLASGVVRAADNTLADDEALVERISTPAGRDVARYYLRALATALESR